MADNEAGADRMDTGGGQEQGEIQVETGGGDGGSGGGYAVNNAGGQESGDAEEDFVRERRTDLLPVGRVVAQKVDGHTSDCSVKLKLSIETFLTDVYRMPSWWLELPSLDDCQSVTHRKILIEVVPLGGRSGVEIICDTRNMMIADHGRLLFGRYLVVLKRGTCGHAPTWFNKRLSELTSSREQYSNSDFLLEAIQGATVYVRQADVVALRPWTVE
jgi:hypothetical protein